MAFRPIYGLSTNITAPTAAGAGIIQIDNSYANLLDAQLGDDYTFASISDGVNFEVIRIDSVAAPNLSVTRGLDGTTTSAFPTGACIRFVWTSEGIAAIATSGGITVTGSGAVTATETSPGVWNVDVPATTITGVSPIQVLGEFPEYEVTFQGTYGGCCGCGGSGGGSGTPITITDTGIAVVTGSDPTFNVGVAAPNFIGASGVTVTGTWPNITFTGPGVIPPSGVSSVTGSTKILISGTASNPVVNLLTTGVGAGTYNGLTFDAYGTITAVNLTYVPLTTIVSTSSSLNVVSIAGGTATLSMDDAAVGARGVVALADATNAASNNPGDAVSAVTPAGIAAVLAAYVPPSSISAGLDGAYDPDLVANYTNALTPGSVTFAVAAGEKATLTAVVSLQDSALAAGAVPQWGLAIFGGASLIEGIEPTYAGTLMIRVVLTGPIASTAYQIRTTALSGTTNITAQSLDYMTYTV